MMSKTAICFHRHCLNEEIFKEDKLFASSRTPSFYRVFRADNNIRKDISTEKTKGKKGLFNFNGIRTMEYRFSETKPIGFTANLRTKYNTQPWFRRSTCACQILSFLPQDKDKLCAPLLQLGPEGVRIIRFVANKVLRRLPKLIDRLLDKRYLMWGGRGNGYPQRNTSAQSIWPFLSSLLMKIRQTFSQTPCSSHNFNRLQQVLGLGYFSGKSFHLAPVRRIQRMASNTNRLSFQGLPLFFSFGSNGPISFHSFSVMYIARLIGLYPSHEPFIDNQL